MKTFNYILIFIIFFLGFGEDKKFNVNNNTEKDYLLKYNDITNGYFLADAPFCVTTITPAIGKNPPVGNYRAEPNAVVEFYGTRNIDGAGNGDIPFKWSFSPPFGHVLNIQRDGYYFASSWVRSWKNGVIVAQDWDEVPVQFGWLNPYVRWDYGYLTRKLSNSDGFHRGIPGHVNMDPPNPLRITEEALAFYPPFNVISPRAAGRLEICIDPPIAGPPVIQEGRTLTCGFAQANAKPPYFPVIDEQKSYAFSVVIFRAITDDVDAMTGKVLRTYIIKEITNWGNAAPSKKHAKAKKSTINTLITIFGKRPIDNFTTASDTVIDVPLSEFKFEILEQKLSENSNSFSNYWDEDIVYIGCQKAEFVFKFLSPRYNSKQGFMILKIDSGKVVESRDSLFFDGVLPDIGTSTPLTFALNNEIEMEYDVSEIVDSLDADSIKIGPEFPTGDESYVGDIFEDTPLPVEFSVFSSSVFENNVELIWTTSSELNNSGFDIERKNSESNQWKNVGYAEGNGTTNEPKHYIFIDRNLDKGRYSYRLKQIDFNGNFEYFYLENEVTVGAPDKYALSQNYPNPFNPVTKISYDIPIPGKVLIAVYDITGRMVKSVVNEYKDAGYYTAEFNAESFSSGVYFYKIESGNFTSAKKMILLK